MHQGTHHGKLAFGQPAAPFPRQMPTGSRRLPQAALLCCAVLLLHIAALRGLAASQAPGPHPTPNAAMQVRQVTVPPPAPWPPATAVAALDTAEAAARAPTRTSTRTPPRTSTLTPTLTSAPAAEPLGQRPYTGPVTAPPDAPPVPDGEPVPTYVTLLAPPFTLVYEMQRGGRTGQAALRWRPNAARYELELDASEVGPQAPGSASQGGFDAAGLAPERFVDRRRGRDQRAVNFQRDGGFISFSGPQLTHTLQPGAQDRLSWMLQLPAILQANPALAAAGSQVSLWVASARGESDAWTFTALGPDALDLPGGRVEGLLRLLRRPQRPFDMQVEVWLDPARHHLPVQVLLALRPGGQPTELRLLSLSMP